MRIVIPGGSGQVGTLLARAFRGSGDEVVVLSRSADAGSRVVAWDGHSLGEWRHELEGADVVINLAGRSVNCRYTATNLAAMMSSRVDSTRVVGEAIAACKQPPRVWLQMSTATIYAHRSDAANDEATGIIGGSEPDAPAYWKRSIEIAQAWEATLAAARTPQTRKVALRAAMVMSADKGGIFDVLHKIARFGLGGPVGSGRQYVSWIHGEDFVAAIRLLIARDDFTGPVNLSAPNPLPQREFMAHLRGAIGTRFGLPATKWMAEIGAFVLRTDTELLLKSRRVVPGRLLNAGFEFKHPSWPEAARELVAKTRLPVG